MKFFKPTVVAIALLSVMGCQEQAKQEEKPAVLETEIQKQAYGLGASIGMYMERKLRRTQQNGLSVR